MANPKTISRRQFVASTASTLALASLPVRRVFAGTPEAGVANSAPQQATSSLSESPNWRDSDWKNQGIENLRKSPHAKLRDIPVNAVTIQSGFWPQRRETNVTKSIPACYERIVCDFACTLDAAHFVENRREAPYFTAPEAGAKEFDAFAAFNS